MEILYQAFLSDEMKIGEENLKKVQFDHVHHIGKKQKKQDNKTRVLIAEFNPSYGKDIVMRHTENLDKRTKRYGVNEQLPRELGRKEQTPIATIWWSTGGSEGT